jgi:RNase P subunit RPR2
VCKRCETTLLPAITSTTRIKCESLFIKVKNDMLLIIFSIAKPVPTAITKCKICKAKKQFTLQNPDYIEFNNRPDNFVPKSE